MLLNMGISMLVFLSLAVIGLIGWTVNDNDETLWRAFFMWVTMVSLIGFSICFIAAIILMIRGG